MGNHKSCGHGMLEKAEGKSSLKLCNKPKVVSDNSDDIGT